MSTKLSNIKDRINAMQASIDESKGAIRELQTQYEEQAQRAEQFEEEAKVLNMKIRETEDRQCDRESELCSLKVKMLEIETESEENSRFSRVLRMREQANQERHHELENLIEQQTSEIERLDRVNSDLQRNCQQMEDKLEEAENRGSQLKCILDESQEEMNQLRNTFKSKEASKKDMDEKFDKWDYECTVNADRLAETTCRAEEAEKCRSTLEKKMCDLEEELQEYKEKTKSCQFELSQIESEVDHL